MLRYVIRENIRRFHELLAGPLDAEQRDLVKRLLATEEQRLAQLGEAPEAAPSDTPQTDHAPHGPRGD